MSVILSVCLYKFVFRFDIPVGERISLLQDEESPFLGDLDHGETQPAIVNNLFKAPMFRHRLTYPAVSSDSMTGSSMFNLCLFYVS